MYLEMMRRGIEFDAEHAFQNLPEPRDWQTTWDVIDDTYLHFFDKFLHMTDGYETAEVAEHRKELLHALNRIAIHCNAMTVSLHDHVNALWSRTYDRYAYRLEIDPPNSPGV